MTDAEKLDAIYTLVLELIRSRDHPKLRKIVEVIESG